MPRNGTAITAVKEKNSNNRASTYLHRGIYPRMCYYCMCVTVRTKYLSYGGVGY